MLLYSIIAVTLCINVTAITSPLFYNIIYVTLHDNVISIMISISKEFLLHYIMM